MKNKVLTTAGSLQLHPAPRQIILHAGNLYVWSSFSGREVLNLHCSVAAGMHLPAGTLWWSWRMQESIPCIQCGAPCWLPDRHDLTKPQDDLPAALYYYHPLSAKKWGAGTFKVTLHSWESEFKANLPIWWTMLSFGYTKLLATYLVLFQKFFSSGTELSEGHALPISPTDSKPPKESKKLF